MRLFPLFAAVALALVAVSCSRSKEGGPELSPKVMQQAAAQPKEEDYAKLKYRNELFTDPQSGQPFTGIAHDSYKSGKPKAEYPFKNGKYDGTVKEWWENGNKKAETEFKDGERLGKNSEWTEAGKLFHTRVYDHDRIVSETPGDAK
jgi:antitoxin component YwqK of YwqJK toxin-antitoxin module